MGFSLSPQLYDKSKITLDNVFIKEYMPLAPEGYVKVYLYAFMLAGSSEKADLDFVAGHLNVPAAFVAEALDYWHGEGVVVFHHAGEGADFTLEFLPVTPRAGRIKKFSKEKYKGFNDQLFAMLPRRNFLPSDFHEMYCVMEDYKIESEAMLTIIGYCLKQKGEDVHVNYFTTVARNLALEGLTTFDAVVERINEFGLLDGDLKAVFAALRLKSAPAHDDLKLLNKWRKLLGFDLSVIIETARRVKKGGMPMLNAMLTRYAELGKLSSAEIEDFEKTRSEMISVAKGVADILGLRYEKYDFLVETYISPWRDMGYAENTILEVARLSSRANRRSFELLGETLVKLFRQGIISHESICQHIEALARTDRKIRGVFELLGIDRAVTGENRDLYKIWTMDWHMSDQLIEYAGGLARGKLNPFAYVNSILADWHGKGVDTVEKAKAHSPQSLKETAATDSKVKKNYSAEELNAMFENIKYEDI